MFPIPANNPFTNAPNNAVHGFFSDNGGIVSTTPPEKAFAVADGVYIILVTLIGAGVGSVTDGTVDTYFGPSSNPYFKSLGQPAGTTGGGVAGGQFASLGTNGQSGISTGAGLLGIGGSTPLGQGGLGVGGASNAIGFGSGAVDGVPVGFAAGAWFWRVPLQVTPGMIIPYKLSFASSNNANKGGPAYLGVEW